jgi:pimeloyl-ACP methyl ester carboxylesterase
MVALQLALDSPEYLDRLILVSTVARGTQDNGAREPFPPPAPWWVEDPVERVRRTLPHLVGAEYLAGLDDAEAESIAASYRGNRVTWAGMLRQSAALANHDLQPRLGEVRAPTLVVHGEADALVPAEQGVVLASGIPGARLLALPGVGHFPWVERPGEVFEVMLSFLGKES